MELQILYRHVELEIEFLEVTYNWDQECFSFSLKCCYISHFVNYVSIFIVESGSGLEGEFLPVSRMCLSD